MISITAEACVHSQCVSAKCEACVRNCHAQAWAWSEEGLAFDDALCDECGVCVAACPTEAITQSGPLPALAPHPQTGKMYAWLRCDHNLPQQEPDHAGTIPCLHAISLQWLHEVLSRHIAGIKLVLGDCATCARCPKDPSVRLDHKLTALQQRVPTWHANSIDILPAGSWHTAAQQGAPQVQRRRFLGLFAKGPMQVFKDSLPVAGLTLSSDSGYANQLVQQHQPAAAFWDLQLDTDKCTWCFACAKLCPNTALTHTQQRGPHQEDDVFALQLNPYACVGCGICTDVCEDHALRLERVTTTSTASTPVTYHLQEVKCSSCKTPFLQLKDSTQPQQQQCSVCAKGRWQQFDRLVQED